MAFTCDIVLSWNATPIQLTAVGTALWRWCLGSSDDARMYSNINSQVLSDLIAGTFPAQNQGQGRACERGIQFTIRDELSVGRQATIDSLRRELPIGGIEDILIAGKSWKAA